MQPVRRESIGPIMEGPIKTEILATRCLSESPLIFLHFVDLTPPLWASMPMAPVVSNTRGTLANGGRADHAAPTAVCARARVCAMEESDNG